MKPREMFMLEQIKLKVKHIPSSHSLFSRAFYEIML